MALNSSGPISLAGTTVGQSIEKENGGNGTTQISLNDTAVRTLAGVASGAITMPTNFWGKSNYTPSSQTFTASGTSTTPAGTGRVVFEVYGSGGSGGLGNAVWGSEGGYTSQGVNGNAGGQTSVNGVIANGGAGGLARLYNGSGGGGGAGGTGSGGTTNTTGNAGGAGSYAVNTSTQYREDGSPYTQYLYYPASGAGGTGVGAGGNAADGTRYQFTDYPITPSTTIWGSGGGGAGGFSTKQITTGIAASYSVVVGAAGTAISFVNPDPNNPPPGPSGAGTKGRVVISYYAS